MENTLHFVICGALNASTMEERAVWSHAVNIDTPLDWEEKAVIMMAISAFGKEVHDTMTELHGDAPWNVNLVVTEYVGTMSLRHHVNMLWSDAVNMTYDEMFEV